MSDALSRLARFCFQRRWLTLAGWAVIVAVSATLAAVHMREPSDSFEIPGTEAQQAIQRLESEFPGSGGAQVSMVFAAPEGQSITSYLPQVQTTITELRGSEAVADVTDTLSLLGAGSAQPDAEPPRAIIIPATLKDPTGEVSEASIEAVTAIAEQNSRDGLRIEVGGLGQQGPGEVLGVGEIAGVVVAALVLIITLGSLIAAGMPLAIALVGVGTGAALIYAVGGFVDITATTPVLAIMLGLAVGIDYALFIITRYRHYLAEKLQPLEAMGRTAGTAGNAVVFAALTVIIALAALSVVGIPFLTSMGLAAAGTVALVALIAITLLPALIGFAGRRILPRKQRMGTASEMATPRFIHGWSKLSSAKPWLTVSAIVVALGLLAIPVTSLRLGLPDASTAEPGTTQREAYDLISETYGPGYNAPLVMLLDLPAGSTQADLAAVAERVSSYSPNAIPTEVNQAGAAGIITVIPPEGPSAESTRELIATLRTNQDFITGEEATGLAITGNTALAVDVDSKLAAALPVYLGVVVGLSLLLLIVVFRSLLVPLKATLGFLLSVGASFGLVVVVFQWGWFGFFEPSPIVSFLPVLMIGILFGLAMDYQFFLVSGMHEAFAAEKRKPADAVRIGFERGAPVVVAAALIMTAVFAGFIFSHDTIIRMIGFGLAVGVLIDAFIVRMTLVPAIMYLFGRAAWWLPKRLDKALPDINIEGK